MVERSNAGGKDLPDSPGQEVQNEVRFCPSVAQLTFLWFARNACKALHNEWRKENLGHLERCLATGNTESRHVHGSLVSKH